MGSHRRVHVMYSPVSGEERSVEGRKASVLGTRSSVRERKTVYAEVQVRKKKRKTHRATWLRFPTLEQQNSVKLTGTKLGEKRETVNLCVVVWFLRVAIPKVVFSRLVSVCLRYTLSRPQLEYNSNVLESLFHWGI